MPAGGVLTTVTPRKGRGPGEAQPLTQPRTLRAGREPRVRRRPSVHHWGDGSAGSGASTRAE